MSSRIKAAIRMPKTDPEPSVSNVSPITTTAATG